MINDNDSLHYWGSSFPWPLQVKMELLLLIFSLDSWCSGSSKLCLLQAAELPATWEHFAAWWLLLLMRMMLRFRPTWWTSYKFFGRLSFVCSPPMGMLREISPLPESPWMLLSKCSSPPRSVSCRAESCTVLLHIVFLLCTACFVLHSALSKGQKANIWFCDVMFQSPSCLVKWQSPIAIVRLLTH